MAQCNTYYIAYLLCKSENPSLIHRTYRKSQVPWLLLVITAVLETEPEA